MAVSRREFTLGALALAGSAPHIIGQAKAQNSVVTRPNIASLTADHPVILAYKEAIKRMMSLTPSDRRSWYQQGRIHLKTCPHGNWHFLPWHREYLRRFELIIREMSGYEEFALPYWDWINDRQIPAMFWRASPTDDNPLDIASLNFSAFEAADAELKAYNDFTGRTRAIDRNGLVGDDGLFTNERIKDQIRLTAFTDFASVPSATLRPGITSSEFEGAFHGTVHVDIGGPMGSFYSPLDPIFWLHHANVDRLWTLWGRQNPNVIPPAGWRDFELPAGMFVNPDGTGAVTIKHRDLLLTPPLGYVYEPVPNQQIASTPVAFTGDPPPPVLSRLTNDATRMIATGLFGSLSVEVPPELEKKVFSDAKPAKFGLEGAQFAPRNRVVARVKVSEIAKKNIAKYRVFLNCSYLNKNTSTLDPHYVTRISQFGLNHGPEGGEAHQGGRKFEFDLTNALDAIARSGEPRLDNKLTVQIQALRRDGAQEFLKVLAAGDLEVDIL